MKSQKKRKSSKGNFYDIKNIEEVCRNLDEVVSRPKKEKIKTYEAIKYMYDRIKILQSKQFTIYEICTILSDNGIHIQTETLRNYMSRIKKELVSKDKIPPQPQTNTRYDPIARSNKNI